MQNKIIPYDENYVEQVFVFWYSSGRIPPAKLIGLDDFPKDQFGRAPVRQVVEAWLNERGWRERADVLDAQAETKISDELVARKVLMLRKQAAQAAAVRERAFDYIQNEGFDSSASAVAAFVKASELERITLGLSKMIEKLSGMRDDEIMEKVKELSERAGMTTIDAETVPEEDAEPLD